MQKLAVSFTVSLVVCLITMYINYQSYQETKYLAWSHPVHGGEITLEFAPGWRAVHIYAMRQEDRDSHKLVFSPVSLAVCLTALTLVNRGLLAGGSPGAPFRDALLLLAGYAVLFLGYRVLQALMDQFG